ncbi:MAG: baseplate J/gp47 family protein [bacterium]|nr:baseplate J/gp47 family protein [bacterium]
MNRRFLPDIAFCETDTRKVEAAIITGYEEAAGVTLYPGDPVRLFMEGVAFLIAQQNVLIDFTGKQNLLHYAVDGYLEHLGNYLHTYRLKPQAARATFAVTLASVRTEALHIPQGIRIRAGNSVVFATVEELIIPAGELSGLVDGVCETEGVQGNGFLPGQIRQLVDPVAHVRSVVNTTESRGGMDMEDDEGLRGRIALAAEAYGSAGSLDAYRYHVKSVHQGIIDEAIWQPEPGEVYIAPLMVGGELPSDEVIKAVHDHLVRDDIRPFTDLPTVVKPTVIKGSVSLRYYILVSYAARSTAIIAQVNAAVEAYIAWQRAVLGRDVLPSKLIEFIQGVEGIQRVEVESPAFMPLDPWEVAHLAVSEVSYGGLAHE